ncbi:MULTISPECIES: type IV toxin-antitoxin system AbiEi family antitoxin domain-containing protein [Mumia]|uniref:Type IV toxin-antitoxin system AbiEi family antitoxin domain-containing protein n=2 Tax=Mumia TaxID=1546255 RepID=A0ABW1QM94_9ACTN|nr:MULTISPECIES: type IV toxin-antitoxin system AbiEi family antitoxin domain-containing protein [Mumia]
MQPWDEMLAQQSGVIARRQLLDVGLRPHHIRRMLRRRELSPLFPGVYLDHTGAATWRQRAWGAVLYAWPAALSGESAIRAAERVRLDSTADDVVEVAIDRRRDVAKQPGLRVTRRKDLETMVSWNRSPPRLHYEEAVLDLATECDDKIDGVAVLARACASRRTTADRILSVMRRRARVRRRRWFRAVLADIASGTHSVLEHGYLRRVEHPHGLPAARRQLKAVGSEGTVYRDADLRLLVVELDGRIYHESATQRDSDLDRHLDVLVEGRPTARLGWGQVFRWPCRTAAKLALILQQHGWTGEPERCASPDCAIVDGA